MMDNWKGDQYNPEFTRTKSHNKKPPLGSWQSTMPSWEKDFCKSVAGIPWYKIMEMKRCICFYENVLQWNDSAGEETFHNAKKRFYAKIHGLPCDVTLPNPDIFIDEVDWNSHIDPELVLDLDCGPLIPDGEKRYAGVVIMDSLLEDQGFSSSGWGDCEQKVEKDAHPLENNENGRDHNISHCNGNVEENGWGDFSNTTQRWDENDGGRVGDNGWGDGWNSNDNNNSRGQNGYENDSNRGEWGDGNNSRGQIRYENNESNRGEWGDGWNSNNSLGQNKYEDNKNSAEWRNGWNGNNSWGQNKYEDNNKSGEWGNGWNSNNSWGRSKYENNHSGVDKGRREDTGMYMSRYKTSRFSGRDDKRNHKWRNGSGRNNNYYVPLN